MGHRFDIAFYFSGDGRPASINYSPAPESVPFEPKLAVFCLHTARALVNTAHDTGGVLARTLMNPTSLREEFLERPRYRVQASVEPQKKRVLIDAQIDGGKAWVRFLRSWRDDGTP